MSAFSIELMRDLYTHMEWADSAVWHAALATPEVGADDNIRDRLVHIHMTQRGFLQVWTKQPLPPFQGLKFGDLRAVYTWMRPYYHDVLALLGTLHSTDLTTITPVPWAKYFVKPTGRVPGVTMLGETMFQVTSHSTYHRGQVNTRLRELGAEPPTVDYIAWLWQGRPAPMWPDSAGGVVRHDGP